MNETALDDVDAGLSEIDERIAKLVDAKLAEIDRRIAELNETRDKLVTIRSTMADAVELLESLEPKPTKPPKPPPKEPPKSQQLAMVQEFFRAKRNAWADTTEISKGTDLPSHTIRQMLYARYPEQFETRPHPEKERRKQFRLA